MSAVGPDGRASLLLLPAGAADPLVLLPQRVTRPRWGPDGSELYFVAEIGREAGVFRIAVDQETGAPAGAPRSVLSGPGIEDFDVAPDGTVAYTALRRRANLWMADLAELPASVRQATRGTAPVSSPALDPSGSRVAFARNGDVWVGAADSADDERVTHLAADISAIRWSADGAKLAFIVRTPSQRSLMVVGAGGGTPRRVPLEHPLPYDLDPILTWAGGEAVVYVGADDAGWPRVLAKVDLVTGEDRVVAQRSDLTGAYLGAVASGDGTRVAVADASGALQILTLDGNVVAEVFPDEPGRPALWTSGDWIVLRSLLEPKRLVAVRPDRRQTTLFARLPIECAGVALDQDATQAACVVLESLERDVWIARPSSPDASAPAP